MSGEIYIKAAKEAFGSSADLTSTMHVSIPDGVSYKIARLHVIDVITRELESWFADECVSSFIQKPKEI